MVVFLLVFGISFFLYSSTMPLAVEQETKVVSLWYETRSYVEPGGWNSITRHGPTNYDIQCVVKHFKDKARVLCTTRARPKVVSQSKGNIGRPE